MTVTSSQEKVKIKLESYLQKQVYPDRQLLIGVDMAHQAAGYIVYKA